MDDNKKGLLKKHYLFVIVLIMAICIRCYLFQYSYDMFGDQSSYMSLAENLANGNFAFSRTLPFTLQDGGVSNYWAPLYPFLCAPIAWLFNDAPLACVVVSTIMGIGTVILIYSFSHQSLPHRVFDRARRPPGHSWLRSRFLRWHGGRRPEPGRRYF